MRAEVGGSLLRTEVCPAIILFTKLYLSPPLLGCLSTLTCQSMWSGGNH